MEHRSTVIPQCKIKAIVCSIAILTLCLASTPLSATTYTYVINDLTDIISATVNGGPLSLTTHGTEEVSFSLQNVTAPNINANRYVDIFEPGSSTLSDRIGFNFVSAAGASPYLEVRFCSDPSNFVYCQVGSFDHSFAENGALQEAYIFSSGGNTYDFYIESAVPEPTSLVLLGSGLTLLGGLTKKLRR